jgi:hypothetical protein
MFKVVVIGACLVGASVLGGPSKQALVKKVADLENVIKLFESMVVASTSPDTADYITALDVAGRHITIHGTPFPGSENSFRNFERLVEETFVQVFKTLAEASGIITVDTTLVTSLNDSQAVVTNRLFKKVTEGNGIRRSLRFFNILSAIFTKIDNLSLRTKFLSAVHGIVSDQQNKLADQIKTFESNSQVAERAEMKKSLQDVLTRLEL